MDDVRGKRDDGRNESPSVVWLHWRASGVEMNDNKL
jgi:hypothetical protein